MNMKRRHSGHMGGGMNHGGHGGGHRGPRPQGRYNPNYNPQRARKNYPAMREKYMNQARDAMSAGDRVLAEYYLQHADHCFRMQQEFLAERAQRYPQQQAQPGQEGQNNLPQQDSAEDTGPVEEEVNLSSSATALPAFLTGGAPAQQQGEQKPPVSPNWEEE